MTNWKSTLGHPLSEADAARITDSWHALREVVCFARSDLEPTEMLDVITDIIMVCWEVRRAVDDAWYNANKLAAPKAPPTREDWSRTMRAQPVAEALRQLGFTSVEQLLAAVKDVQK